MKKLAIISLALMSTAVFAGGSNHGPKPPPSNPPAQACAVCETGDINVGAPQIQLTVLKDTSVIGKASGNMSRANNNLSSNTYGVDLRAESIQITALKDSGVAAKATGNESVAQNNLASNIGSVAVAANQQQTVTTSGLSYIGAYSNDHSTAVQNFSTNNACLDCNPHARRGPRPN